jgi:hypothetical protein
VTRIRPPADSRRRNALILALKGAIEAMFSESDWKELGYQTDTQDYISSHPRLLRSLSWGDPDYGGHVLDAIELIIERDPANLEILANHPVVAAWIKKNQPDIQHEFFGSGGVAQVIQRSEKAAKGFDIDAYVKRIQGALPDDPALAVGSTKELLESVLKTILGIHGAEISAEDMPKLLKRAQAALGLDPKDVQTDAPGSEPLRRMLGSLAQIVVAVTELRNIYGTGHGKSKAPGLDLASTHLVVSSGIAAATYMMERYRAMKA